MKEDPINMLMERAFLGIRSTVSALRYVHFFIKLNSFITSALPSILRLKTYAIGFESIVGALARE